MKEALILSRARTPLGSFQGSLSSIPSTRLGGLVIAEAVRRAGIPKTEVEQVIMGCVLPAGLGQAPARQATLLAGLDPRVSSLTVNKVCGSGLKAVALAAQEIWLGNSELLVGGGMESMTGAPYLLKQARGGFRMGNGEVVDGMIHDGLWDPYANCHMGSFADKTADDYKITRAEQDEFAAESYRRALKSQAEGRFKEEIVPVEIPMKKGEPVVISEDEEPKRVKFEKIPALPPAFNKNGTVTAANASSINDGAAALVLASAEKARALKLKPLARVLAYGEHSQEPQWFATAPPASIEKALQKAGLKVKDIDVFEINEAFSVVTLYALRQLKIDPAKVNIYGGAAAIGHPIGASGARLLCTLITVLKDRGGRYGLASLCVGGGEAVTMIIEKI
ncbi:MAG: thiolase family protein [bacterium]|nr:thiolase family protein [bacterium]